MPYIYYKAALILILYNRLIYHFIAILWIQDFKLTSFLLSNARKALKIVEFAQLQSMSESSEIFKIDSEQKSDRDRTNKTPTVKHLAGALGEPEVLDKFLSTQ